MKIVLFLACVFLAACGGSHNEWPDGDRNDFLGACVNAGGGASQCKCVLEELENRYDTADEAIRNLDNEEIVDVVDACDD